MNKAVFFGALTFIAFVGCGLKGLDKTLGSGQKDAYGCFVNTEVDCFDMAGKWDGCCLNTFTCGGGKFSVGCPANACCDIDNYIPDGMRAQPNYKVVGPIRKP